MSSVVSFTDLDAWKISHKLVLLIYKAAKLFPKDEKFILIPQLLRSSISITSNIAEGFSRQNKREKIQFYYIAKGSLTEAQNQLILAKDLGYINSELFKEISELSVNSHKLINGLIRSYKRNH